MSLLKQEDMKFLVTFIDKGNCEIASVTVEAGNFTAAIPRAVTQVAITGTMDQFDATYDTKRIIIEVIDPPVALSEGFVEGALG